MHDLLLPLLLVLLLTQCKGGSEGAAPPEPIHQDAPKKSATTALPEVKPPAPLKKEIKDPITYCSEGTCKVIDRSEVTPRGLSLIDLSDTFTPFIFTERSHPKEAALPNTYRKTYLNLSNDVTDEDGRALKPGEHNYLELYGIPPTLSVLQKRFHKTATAPCASSTTYELFSKLRYNLVYSAGNPQKYYRRYTYAKRRFTRYIKRKRIADPEAYLTSKGKKPRIVRTYQKAKMRYEAFLALQARLLCENVISQKQVRKNVFDLALKKAIRKYERKHMIFGWGFVNKRLRRHLSRFMLENDFEAFRRMVYERVAHSLGIFEDGSIRTYNREKRKRERVDLIGRFRDLLLQEMGLTTALKVRAWFKAHHSKDFEHLEVAVKLPQLPDYYAKEMAFFVRHSVGDLWYDVPYTPTGQRKGQPRSILPSVTLYVLHKGRKIPLTRMGTTAGGWQKEYVQKQVFLKYKSSDLGPKEWKFIVGAPVWFPPPTTPPRELITYARIRGRTRAVLRRKSFGPSYASAYGLAMALHTFTKKRRGKIIDLDRGIRTHGSVNYMSIRVGHSHGCHRLHNHIALRLFSNLLRRHPHKRLGQIKTDWSHFVRAGGRNLKLHLTTKGYYYEMTPPIPIRVGRGNILGRVKQRIQHLIRIPGRTYPPDLEIGMEIAPDGSLQPVGTDDATAVKTDLPSALPGDPPSATNTPEKKPESPPQPNTAAPTQKVPAPQKPAVKGGARTTAPSPKVPVPAKPPVMRGGSEATTSTTKGK